MKQDWCCILIYMLILRNQLRWIVLQITKPCVIAVRRNESHSTNIGAKKKKTHVFHHLLFIILIPTWRVLHNIFKHWNLNCRHCSTAISFTPAVNVDTFGMVSSSKKPHDSIRSSIIHGMLGWGSVMLAEGPHGKRPPSLQSLLFILIHQQFPFYFLTHQKLKFLC